MEPLLTLWIGNLNKKIIPLTQHANASKAELFNEIQQNKGGNEAFTTSKGWFARFRQRSHIHCIKISGEAASAHIEATCTFTAELKKIIMDDKFSPNGILSTSAIVGYSFAIKTICLERLLLLDNAPGIHHTWKMLSQSLRLR
jgi:hypothetical protein